MLDRRLPHGARVARADRPAARPLLLLAGCGGSDSIALEQPRARIPPRSRPPTPRVYGEAVVRPSGDMKAGVVAAARKVCRVDDPGAELTRLLDESATGDTSFSRDVEPWLGRRVGGFLLMPSGGSTDPDWAIAIAIADRGAFDDALPRLRRAASTRPAAYRGVAYDRGRQRRHVRGARRRLLRRRHASPA